MSGAGHVCDPAGAEPLGRDQVAGTNFSADVTCNSAWIWLIVESCNSVLLNPFTLWIEARGCSWSTALPELLDVFWGWQLLSLYLHGTRALAELGAGWQCQVGKGRTGCISPEELGGERVIQLYYCMCCISMLLGAPCCFWFDVRIMRLPGYQYDPKDQC